jgi:aminoglycoside 6-adenylyltransferase
VRAQRGKMKTRSEKEMLDLIVGFANSDERIRVTLMNGSRVNPNLKKDPFQDYDIANFVTDVNPFRNEKYVLPHFGEALVVEQPSLGPWPAEDDDGSYHNYNIQLLDGNRIDISFNPMHALDKKIKDSLTKVLLDKDNRIPSLPPSNESSYYLAEPNRTLYKGCCDGFFFTLGSHIPKTIWRRQIPLLKFYIDACLRDPLLLMLGWEIGIKTGWDKSIGSRGKYLQKHLDTETWAEYEQTFVGMGYEALWNSLFLLLRIFVKSAKFVAARFDFNFPEEQAKQIEEFLKHVRSLPADADQIYKD